jgi:HAD superfamily hydrolase (TIGR01509 family)
MTEQEYINHLQKKLPPDYEAEKIIKCWYGSFELDQDIFKLIQKLRPTYKIAAFSGNIRERIDYLEKKYNFRHLFDQEIYSFDCGYTKPEPEFFAHFVDSLQTNPKEILHVDDNDNSLEQLRPFGVDCLIYKRGKINALLKELRALDIKI